MTALMVIAALADAVTFVALPKGGELNPLVAALLVISPVAALAAKAGVVVELVLVGDYLRRYRTPVYASACLAWGFGAASNVLTIASWRVS